MADQPSNHQGNATGTGSVDRAKAENLLEKAILQPVGKPNCKHQWGKHEWERHAETGVEFCRNCSIRKDKWEEATKGEPTGNQQATEKPDNTGLEQDKKDKKEGEYEWLKPTQFKPGESGNPAGRPKGSRNLTTIVMEALKAKKITVKLPDGTLATISGEEAFAEAVLENAIKKKDRESLRMIWEMSDGKPTQQHKLEVNGPRGYEIDPAREAMYLEQFDMAAGMTVKASKTVRTEVQTIEVTKEATPTPIATPEPSQVANQG